MTHFEWGYKFILHNILNEGYEEVNERTKKSVRALPGITVQVDLQKEFPLVSSRKINVKNAIAEVLWFLQGIKDTKQLEERTKIWSAFTEKNGEVATAYGYRWRNHFGRDQILDLVKLLKKDPSSRHGVVITWDPAADGLMGTPQKNIPCPYTFTVNIMGGKLHLHNIVRSNDMVLGFPTDVVSFSLLQLMLAQELGVDPGIYTHSISNAHIYGDHFDAADDMFLREAYTMPPIEIPSSSFQRALNNDLTLYQELIDCFHNYKHCGEIKGLVIAL